MRKSPSEENLELAEHHDRLAVLAEHRAAGAADEWREGDHPRRDDGKFGAGGGSKATKSSNRDAITKVLPEVGRAWAANWSSTKEMVNKRVVAQGGKPLDDEELGVARAYMAYGSGAINTPLREAPHLMKPEERAVAETMDRALSKLPKYSGPVTRMMDVSAGSLPKLLETFKPGAIIKSPAFSSGAEGDKPARGFGGNVELKIQSKGGARKFSAISAFGSDEREVIFGRGARFKVDTVKKAGNKYRIALTEDPGPSQATDATWNEGDHPRAPDGRFGSKAGSHAGKEGGSSRTQGMLPLSGKDPRSGVAGKSNGIADLLKRGVTNKELLAHTGWKAINIPRVALALGLKIEKTGLVYKGVPMSPEELKAAKEEAARKAVERKKKEAGPVAPKPEPKPAPEPEKKKAEASGAKLAATIKLTPREERFLSKDDRERVIKFAERTTAGAKALPAAHRDMLANVQINVVNEPTQKNITVSGQGYAGLYNWEGNVEIPRLAMGGWQLYNTENVVAHELGHAIDHKYEWVLGELVAPFVDADAKGMIDKERERSKYWFTNNKERFAELYALAFAGEGTVRPTFFGGMSRKRAEGIFAKSLDFIRSLRIGEKDGPLGPWEGNANPRQHRPDNFWLWDNKKISPELKKKYTDAKKGNP